MAGMRDVLIHLYDEVDLGEVWRTATTSVPEAQRYIASLAPDTGDG